MAARAKSLGEPKRFRDGGRGRLVAAGAARTFGEAEAQRARGNSARAERLYARLLETQPRHLKALRGRARALRDLNRPAEADALDRRARMLEAEDLCTIAHAALFHGRHPAALACYRRAAALDPTLTEAAWGMAEIQCRRGRDGDAVRWYRKILALEPDNPEAGHMLAALGAAEMPPRASDAYVTGYFDRFADYFDRQLGERLAYRVPTLLRMAVERAGPPLRPAASVLDLGCGTGLAGLAVQAMAGRIDGVDLSPAMVAKARARGFYDRLSVAEMTGHMATTRRRYDLVLCADALVYLGDLHPVFDGVMRVLRPGGLFAASTEWRRAGVALMRSGRYAHARAPLRGWAGRAGLMELSSRNATLRTEYGRPVTGTIWLFRKP